MTQMIKFPSIEQLRTVVKNVQHQSRFAGLDDQGEPIFDNTRPIPTLRFVGTVKLHGTNAGIVLDRTSEGFTYQSRERVLTLEQDNAGFMLHMLNHQNSVDNLFATVMFQIDDEKLDSVKYIAVYGEWCGGNIQKGVGISGLPKMFVVFGAKVIYETDADETEGHWIPIQNVMYEDKEAGIYNVHQFGSWTIDIDFNHPQLAQQKLVELTEMVEAECPAGKFFGQCGIGEGIVWQCQEPGYTSSRNWFKVKGEKHSVSKVKTLAPVDVEAYKKQQDFIDSVVTEARLEQGLHNLINEQQKPFEMSSMGDFIRWVFNDVVKEETDTIVANQFDVKKLGGPIANKARPWFIQRLNSEG